MIRARHRVLHVAALFWPDDAGEGTFIESMTPVADALRPDVEHDVLVVRTPRPEQAYRARSTLAKVVYLTGRAGGQTSLSLRLFWWTLVNLWRYDVIHYHAHVDRSFASYLLAKLCGRRSVLSATPGGGVTEIVERYRGLCRPLARRLVRVFDAFISISPKLHDETTRMVDPKKCHLIPVGIPIPELDPAARQRYRKKFDIPDSTVAMIFVGGFDRGRDPRFLLHSLPALAECGKDLLLLIVGPVLDDEYYRDSVAFIEANGLTKNVRFVGCVEDPGEYYAASDIAVVAAHQEGFRTAMIEGMAHAMPVVARLLPGISDAFISHDKTGFLFTGADDFAACMKKLLRDGPLRRKMGEAARAFVQRNFDMPAIAARYLDIYGFPADAPAQAAPASSPAAVSDAPRPQHPHVLTYQARTSVLDHRMRTPVVLPSTVQPMLVTMIDAEEEFDWTKPFSRDSIGVRSMAHQHLAHRVFDRYGVKPTYLIDYPVVSQDDGIKPLIEFLQDDRCEIGTQLHPWVTPPFEEEVSLVNSFIGNLPLGLQYEKILRMVRETEDRLHISPIVFRAGRYGIGRRTADILVDLGFKIDTSIVPRWSFADEGGPDFLGEAPDAFWAGPSRALLELPLTCDYVGKHFLRKRHVGVFAHGPIGEQMLLHGILARSNLLARIKLSPEGVSLDDAKQLTRTMVADGRRILVLSYHTPSLEAGNTPYVRVQEDLDRFLAWLDGYYDFFINEIKGAPISATDLLKRLTA